MDLEEHITKAKEYLGSQLIPAKAAFHVSDGQVLRREGSLVVTMGGILVLQIFDHELLAPPDDAAFWRMIEMKWRRGLESWEGRRRKDTPRVKHGPTAQRPWGRRSLGSR